MYNPAQQDASMEAVYGLNVVGYKGENIAHVTISYLSRCLHRTVRHCSWPAVSPLARPSPQKNGYGQLAHSNTRRCYRPVTDYPGRHRYTIHHLRQHLSTAILGKIYAAASYTRRYQRDLGFYSRITDSLHRYWYCTHHSAAFAASRPY